MTEILKLGFSPCPNDTFMFHDLVHGPVQVEGVTFDYELLDIEELNRRSQEDPPIFDITKLSIPAFARSKHHYTLLSAGAALGRGCGPLVVRAASRENLTSLADLSGARVAIPGQFTTAFMLFQMFGPPDIQVVEMRFDEIMPAVEKGTVEAGLIIHESRFTYQDHGLVQIADVGQLWESQTGLPLPLGVIAARTSLGETRIKQISLALRQSIQNAFDDPTRSATWVAEHAQEMDSSVCQQHIDLYVNEFSLELGAQGESSIHQALAILGKA
jgi:1,4-dihydroxy-6-naphthoate synthase